MIALEPGNRILLGHVPPTQNMIPLAILKVFQGKANN
jgi:hypothetical protein